MSQLFKLDWRDLVKGLVMVLLTSVMVGLLTLLQNNVPLPYLNDPTVRAILSAGLAYLVKNLATDTDGKLVGKV